MQTNALRGLLHEFGIVLPEGHKALLQKIPAELARAADVLPGVLYDSVREQLTRIDCLQQDINLIGQRLVIVGKQNPQMQPLQTIRGIEPLTATALVAVIGSCELTQGGGVKLGRKHLVSTVIDFSGLIRPTISSWR